MYEQHTLNGYTYQLRKGTSGRTVLLLHGVGGDETAMNQIGELLFPGDTWLSPKGKIISDGHARYFTRRADASFDPEQVKQESADMAAFITEAAATHGIDTTNLIALGYSNGGNLIASLLAHHPDLISQAIMLRAMLPVTFENTPKLSQSRALLLNGKHDHIMDQGRVRDLAEYLKSTGADTTLHWVPAGHQLSPYDIAIIEEWLKG